MLRFLRLAAFFVLLSKSLLTNAQTCRQVIGYYPNWQWYDRQKLVNPMTLQYSKYSILNYSFFKPEVSGALSSTDAWADENLLLGQINWQTTPPSYLPNTSIPARAHLAGKKVVASIGGWTLSDNFPSIAATAAKRATFAHGCVALCQQYNFDGVDIDWEYPGYAPHGGGPADFANFPILLQQIRDSLTAYGNATGKTMLLTICLGASPAHMANVNFAAVTPICDYLNLMSYDFFGSWDQTTNHNGPLFAPAEGDPSFNIDAAVNALLTTHQVPAAKINAGLAFYGRSAKTPAAPILHGPQTGAVDMATFPEDEGTPLYYNTLQKLPLFSQQTDATAQVPYLLGINGLNTFVSWDNKNSIAGKANYINSKSLAGAIIWEITGDYLETSPGSGVISGTPLLDTLNARFCGAAPPACAAPMNLTAQNLTLSSAFLSWSAATGAVNYSLQWRFSTASAWTTISNISSSNYALSGLECGKTYQFQVKTNCSAGSSGYSAGPAFSTSACAACPAPTGLAATNLTQTSAFLSWAAAAGATAFNLQYRVAGTTTWTTISNISTSNYALSSLACSKNYQFQVQAICAAGAVSSYSAAATFSTLACPICPTPTALKATNLTQTSAQLGWASVAGAANYTVRYRLSTTTAWTTISNISTNSHLLIGLLCSKSYLFSVAANCTSGGTSTFSANKSFSTLTCAACPVPQNLAATNIQNTSVQLGWTASASAASYQLQWKLATPTTWTTVSNITSNGYFLAGLTACSTYQFRVRTNCAAGNASAYSAAKNFTAGCAAPCTTPMNLAVSSIQNNVVTLGWAAVSGAVSYEIQWKLTSAAAWTAVTGVTSNSHVLQNLVTCSSYDFRVKANCPSGQTSAFSSISTFSTIGCVPCLAPQNLTFSNVQNTTATLAWATVAGAVSYQVDWKLSTATTWNSISNLTSTSHVLQNLSACSSYNFRVKAFCTATQSSAFSSVSTFSTTGCAACISPQNLVVSNLQNTSATLGWAAVAGAVSYQLEWKEGAATTWISVPNLTSNSYVLSGLSACTGYFFRVKTNCAGGQTTAFSYAFDFSTTGCSGDCQAPPSFYFGSNYTPVGEIKLGQGRLHPVWGVSVDAHIPTNRLSWAIADVHAAHLFRNTVGSDKIPANFYHATAAKEAFCGCDNAITAAPAGSPFPYSYQPASVGDGCFQIESLSAYNELAQLFPQRWPAGQHGNLISGKHYCTAALAKAAYDLFAVRWWQVSKGWSPVDFFNQAADPNAARKLIAVAYNRGLWYHALDTVLHFDRTAALAATNISPYFLGNAYGYDYQNALTNYTLVLNNQAALLPPAQTATNPATGQPFNFFTSFYDPQVAWSDVNAYIDSIKILYPTVNFVSFKSLVQAKFNSINAGASVSFRYQFGPVLDEIILRLPADDPTNYIANNYGCTAPQPPPATCDAPQNLTFSNAQNTAATLGWAAVAGAVSYQLDWKLSSNSAWTSISNLTATSHVLQNLTACSSYEFRVKAICSSAQSSTFSTISPFSTIGCATCSAPQNLTFSNVQNTAETLGWAAVSGAVSYQLDWKLSSNSAWTSISNLTATSHVLQNLAACSSYDFRVKAICANGLASAFSAVSTFSTTGCGGTPGPAPNTYCSSFSLNSTQEWVQSVAFGSFSNVSGNNSGFGNFINLNIPLQMGSTVQYVLAPGFAAGTSQTEFWRVWVDWNRDGDFFDAGEKVVDASGTGVIGGSFQAPAAASFGFCRVRMSMKRTAAAAECDVFSLGEVEDYLGLIDNPALLAFSKNESKLIEKTVEKGSKKAVSTIRETSSGQVFELFPNPSDGVFSILFEVEKGKNYALELLDLQGRTVAVQKIGEAESGLFETRIVGFENLPSGVFVALLKGDGAVLAERKWVKN